LPDLEEETGMLEYLVRQIRDALERPPTESEEKEQRREAEIEAAKLDLWKRCQPQIIALVNQFTRGHPDRWRDYHQKAYLELEEAILRFDFSRKIPFAGYLSRVVKNKFIDESRRRVPLPVGILHEEVSSYAPDFEQELVLEDIENRLEETLDALLPNDPLRCRKLFAFKKRHLEEWSLEEIAAELEVSPTQVSQWICRVKKKLQQALLERYPELFEEGCPIP
jgi:RNA polymerase sigma factor (sigma-70 family)